MYPHLFLWQFIALCKAVGYVGTAAAVLIGGIKWLTAIFRKVSSISTDVITLTANVSLLTTNHLPHIQQALDDHGRTLSSITSDVRDLDTKVGGMNTRLEDTQNSVHTLNAAFVRHLDSTTEEHTVTTIRKKRG